MELEEGLKCPNCGSKDTYQVQGHDWICDSCDCEFMDIESSNA